MPEIASRHHLELVNAVVDDALGAGGRDARRRRAGRGHAGARAGRRAARRRRDRQGAGRRAPAAARARSTTCRATSRRTSSRPDPIEPPFLCLIASGGHTLLARVTDHARLRGARAGRSTTPPARRSTRARGCSGSATRAGRRCRSSRPRATRRRSRSRRRARVRGPRLLLRGAQDRAALHGARPGGGGDARAAPPTSRRPTSTRSSRR